MANPFWKNTAKATRMKPYCTNYDPIMHCCTRRIIIIAIRTAGAVKRPIIFRAMDQWFIEIDHEKIPRAGIGLKLAA